MQDAKPPVRRWSLQRFLPLHTLLPTPALFLRSAALASVLVSAGIIAILAWIVFYGALAVQKGRVEHVWLQYGHATPPFALVPLGSSYLASDQPYDVSLLLSVPASTRNFELGNFMVSLALLRADGSAIVNVSRPASLTYSPPPSRFLSALRPFSSAPKQHLAIPLLESTVLQSRWNVPTKAHLQVGRNDAGELHTYGAKLKFDAHLSGLRYLLYHHYILCFLVFVPSFIFCELLSASLLWSLYVARSPPLSSSAPLLPEDSTEGPFDQFLQREMKDEAAERAREMRGVKMEDLGEGSYSESSSITGTEVEEEAVKEGDEDPEEAGTFAGSTTTASRPSTFGPSLASTSATTTTASLRNRPVASTSVLADD